MRYITLSTVYHHILNMVVKHFNLTKNRDEAEKLIEEAMSVVGLRSGEILEKYPHQLSGGQRQRVMVARAYMLRPRLIVADEPVSAVDASLRAMILDIMLRLRDEQGISFLYITHDLSTAYQISDLMYVLFQGTTVERGSDQQDHRKSETPLRSGADRIHSGSKPEGEMGHQYFLTFGRGDANDEFVLAADFIHAARSIWISVVKLSHTW